MRSIAHSLATGFVTFLVLAPAFGQQAPGTGYGPHMWSGGWHWMFFGPFMMIIFIAVAVAVVLLIMRWLGGAAHLHPPPHAPSRKEPIDILKERYAKGEIDKEEFEERRRVLSE
jgi:putative membrane protein